MYIFKWTLQKWAIFVLEFEEWIQYWGREQMTEIKDNGMEVDAGHILSAVYLAKTDHKV